MPKGPAQAAVVVAEKPYVAKFKDLLKELFRLDRKDLDFGIYRVLRARAEEIEQFIDERLLNEIQEGLQTIEAPSERLEAEREVYEHLYRFFRRYYSEGDFISQRVYRDGTYAIPYSGEEVMLHWANKDQYYVKSAEHLRDYSFVIVVAGTERKVHFKLVDVEEGEHGNVKPVSGKERRFMLLSHSLKDFEGDPASRDLVLEGNELTVKFAYRQDSSTQKALGDLIVTSLAGYAPVLGFGLSRDVLTSHVNSYVARNTFDFFIHKDLGGFLNRELDHFVKTEVLDLDDVEMLADGDLSRKMSRIRAMRVVAVKLIKFLASLEDFQKRLWLKKRFVFETNYCITIDLIPDELFSDVLINKKQISEWHSLFLIPEGIRLDRNIYKGLTVNTCHYEGVTRDALISLAESNGLDGVFLNSENMNALRFMQRSYARQIDHIHIDPPYNTNTSGFLYKNNYIHSSWYSMMSDRVFLAKNLLSETGIFQCHIDENEYESLVKIFDSSGLCNLGTVIWDKGNPALGKKGIATQHEYILNFSMELISMLVPKETIKRMKEALRKILLNTNIPPQEKESNYRLWLASQDDLTDGDKAYRYLDEYNRIYRLVAMGAPEKRTDEKYYVPLIHPKTGKECPVPPNGWSRTPETMQDLLQRDMIVFTSDKAQPQKKVYLSDLKQLSSVIRDGSSGKVALDNLSLAFPYAHPVSLYDLLLQQSDTKRVYLDFFAGSGTNGHSVINIIRSTGLRHKSLLVEQGIHFDTTLIPRIRKVIYSENWPLRERSRGTNALSYCFKYIRLESYEDTLNNLELKRTNDQEDELKRTNDQEEERDLYEEYMLSYLFDREAQGNALLSTSAFKDPTAYTLNIKRPGGEESVETRVDLIETFNWLIGLRVHHMRAPITTHGWHRLITGELPNGQKALIIWRKLSDKLTDDNLKLNDLFTQTISEGQRASLDVIYVNGPCTLDQVKTGAEHWNIQLLDEHFTRLMFDTSDVEG